MPEPEIKKDGGTPDPLFTIAEESRVAFPPGGVTEEGGLGGPGVTPEDGLLDPATVEMIVSMPFDFIAARKGPHWKLTPAEKAASTPVATRVANKYSTELLAKWADEAALAVVLVLMIFKRVQIDNEQAQKKEPEKDITPAA